MISSRTCTLYTWRLHIFKVGFVAESQKDEPIYSILLVQQKFLKSKAEDKKEIIRYRSKKA